MPENFERQFAAQPERIINPELTEGALGRDLEELGVVSTKPMEISSRNNVFIGEDTEGTKYLIKKYTEMPGRGQRVTGPRRRTEIECFEHLSGTIPLPRFIKGSQEEEYLIVEFMDLRDLDENKEDVSKAVDLIDGKLGSTPAPFLPGIDDDYYDRRLPAKVDELAERNILNEQQTANAKKILQEQREAIRKAPVAFSHEDLIRENLKKDPNGNIVIIDPEFARQDVVEVDAASLLIDLSNNPELEQFARERFKDNGIVNTNLLRAMEVRRCVDMCRALARRGLTEIPHYQKHLKRLKELSG